MQSLKRTVVVELPSLDENPQMPAVWTEFALFLVLLHVSVFSGPKFFNPLMAVSVSVEKAMPMRAIVIRKLSATVALPYVIAAWFSILLTVAP